MTNIDVMVLDMMISIDTNEDQNVFTMRLLVAVDLRWAAIFQMLFY